MVLAKIKTTIKDLKKAVLLSKKDAPEYSKAYASILKQVEGLTIGVKNPEIDESKIILQAAKKELKEQEQSRDSGAPFSERTLELCSFFVSELQPKTISEEQTRLDILSNIRTISDYAEPDMKTLMAFAKQSGKCYDMKIYSSIVKELLS